MANRAADDGGSDQEADLLQGSFQRMRSAPTGAQRRADLRDHQVPEAEPIPRADSGRFQQGRQEVEHREEDQRDDRQGQGDQAGDHGLQEHLHLNQVGRDPAHFGRPVQLAGDDEVQPLHQSSAEQGLEFGEQVVTVLGDH